ncbi:RES family NAD+ phosphorylase [Mycolicibacterium xanthum]|uniref:RES family NAD+ phosphorylase n=1 Tax=Mycolicibacterium xanthum TaxID=2796469 RepID=UPI0027E2056C|nr:RES family NAD+ phosphorylase [Mycolicibacterium xanthum]
MIGNPDDGPMLWRVGYHLDPLGFTPRELYEFNHRFDDIHRRFRTLYCAESAETCLCEVLADFRPNLAAMRATSNATDTRVPKISRRTRSRHSGAGSMF